MIRGQAQRPGYGVTVRDQDGPVDAGRVQDRQQVGGHLGRRIALRRVRAVGPSGAPAIGRDDGKPARQGRNDPFHDRAYVIGDAGISSSAGSP